MKEVYALVIKDALEPIPLTIAGRMIPQELKSFVETNVEISKFVSFVESPKSMRSLFDAHRILIAPHVYGAGIQYKVSRHDRFKEGKLSFPN